MPLEKTCTKCGAVKPLELFRSDGDKPSGYGQPCRQCDAAGRRARRKPEDWRGKSKRLREEVLDAYGRRCACCGETTPEFLTVDHVHNDGAAHREEIGHRPTQLLYYLKRHDYPKDRFQLLCCNCNFAKGWYGECPHKRDRKLTA